MVRDVMTGLIPAIGAGAAAWILTGSPRFTTAIAVLVGVLATSTGGSNATE
jgi:hypothetical protein